MGPRGAESGEQGRCLWAGLASAAFLVWFYFIFFPPRPSQVPKNFDPTTSFTVEGLKPNTEYVFRLAARSALGLGAFTPEVRERTLQSSRCLSFSHPSLRGRQSGSQRWWAQGYGAVGGRWCSRRVTPLGFLCGEVGGHSDLLPSPFAGQIACEPRAGLVHVLGVRGVMVAPSVDGVKSLSMGRGAEHAQGGRRPSIAQPLSGRGAQAMERGDGAGSGRQEEKGR